MLFVNLLPPERREPESDSYLPPPVDKHSFFSSLLAISGPGGNPILGKIAESNLAAQAEFLSSLARAYAVYVKASALAYRRVAELSRSSQTRDVAQSLFDVEMGREVASDLVSPFEEVRSLIESLIPGLELACFEAEDSPLLKRLKLNHAPLPIALAVCQESAEAAPGVLGAWQDLAAQWQVFLGIRTEKLNHALSASSAESRLELAERMLEPFAELTNSTEYASDRETVRREFARHFDEATGEILSRIP